MNKNILNNFFTKNKGKLFMFAIILLVVVFLYYNLPFSNKKVLYKFDSECAKFSLSFAQDNEWEVLQSMFSMGKNSCFAEFDSGGGITLIYDLTHNKQLALHPANASQLYPEISGGEVSEVRIEHIRKYKEVKSEIFGHGE